MAIKMGTCCNQYFIKILITVGICSWDKIKMYKRLWLIIVFKQKSVIKFFSSLLTDRLLFKDV